ncbi:MAG: LacI family DNA-binding transcriptional regulator [Firmicutes bacterium]|nr:LacI family DNA-binding transcriptional regulator [Bacillota bacterium]
MATLKEIAKIANVNVSTVSKALRDSSDLSEQTKITIRAIADELHYPYSAEGQPAHSNLIGVIFPDAMSPYYMAVLHSLHTNLLEAGFRILMMPSFFSEEEEYVCLKELLRNRVRAIVCFSTNSITSGRFRELVIRSGITFLMISPDENCDFCDNIYIDQWKSVIIAANHLMDLGHKRIAYIGEPFSSPRRKSFETALRARHLDVPPEYIIENGQRFEACGYEGMQTLLKLPNRPTGIFAAYDSIAIGAMRAIQEAGLRIPQDISIVSIDDSNVGNYLNVRLTTVTEPTQDLGELAADLLTQKIVKKRRIMQSIRLQPTLKVRESTAPPEE